MALDAVLLAASAEDVDRSEALARTVADVAGPAAATVHVVHAFTPSGFEDVTRRLNYDPDDPPDPDEVVRRLEAVRTIARTLTQDPLQYGVEYEIDGTVGEKPGPALVSKAREADVDQVFVGGRRRSPAGKAAFGSTAQYVLLNAPCPVTLVRGDHLR